MPSILGSLPASLCATGLWHHFLPAAAHHYHLRAHHEQPLGAAVCHSEPRPADWTVARQHGGWRVPLRKSVLLVLLLQLPPPLPPPPLRLQLMLIPLFIYRQHHPLNLALLGCWTAVFSVTIGVVCSLFRPVLVLEVGDSGAVHCMCTATHIACQPVPGSIDSPLPYFHMHMSASTCLPLPACLSPCVATGPGHHDRTGALHHGVCLLGHAARR